MEINLKNKEINVPDEKDVNREMDDSRDKLIRSYILSNCMNRNVPLKRFINEFEKEMISRALRVSGGNQRIAAFILGLKPTTLNEKIKKFDLKREKKIRDREDLKHLINEINMSSL